MDLISTISLALGSSWVSGINLYATVATLGLLGRFANLQLPGELEVLTNWWVIGIALTLYSIELLVDKIPLLDSAWDAIHTFIRIPAGAMLAAGAFGDFDKATQVVALLLGGGLALSSHGTKAATRAVINTSPEPVSNVVASTLEDILAVGAVLLAVFSPVLLFIIIVIGVIVSVIALPKIIRYLRGIAGRIRGKAKATKQI